MTIDRKAKIREYRDAPRPAGVYRILNTTTGRTLLGTSSDAPARLNRHRAQLRMGSHPNRSLQQDWKSQGEEAFELEVLDLLPERESGEGDLAEDLRVLEELWREKLALNEDATYG